MRKSERLRKKRLKDGLRFAARLARHGPRGDRVAFRHMYEIHLVAMMMAYPHWRLP